MQVTRRLCLCEERCLARDDKRFVHSKERGGWVFVSGPVRRMTAKARYLGSTRDGFEEHIGEPFVWECCPWCGGDLPMTEPYWDTQADGEGAE